MNESTVKTIFPTSLYRSAALVPIDDLRAIAFLIYQLHLIELEESLWKTCQKASRAQLQPSVSDECYWPTMVINTMYHLNRTPVNDGQCQKFVQEQLDQSYFEHQQVKQQYLTKQGSIDNFQHLFEDPLVDFVQKQLQPLRLHYEYRRQLIVYEYQIAMLDRQFSKTHPTATQVGRKIVPNSVVFRYRSIVDRFC